MPGTPTYSIQQPVDDLTPNSLLIQLKGLNTGPHIKCDHPTIPLALPYTANQLTLDKQCDLK
jgi:hypothetical protein